MVRASGVVRPAVEAFLALARNAAAGRPEA